jgi:K+-sensing histidine kinase KdpD
MGLWIARGFISAQNGRMWAENAADGGARVTMVVPLIDADASAAAADRP